MQWSRKQSTSLQPISIGYVLISKYNLYSVKTILIYTILIEQADRLESRSLLEDAVDGIRGTWQIMFCKRCGTQIAQTTKLCPACGTIIEHASMNAQPQTPYGAYAQASHEQSTQQTREYAVPPYGNVKNASPPLNGYATPAYKNAPAYDQDPYKSYPPSASAFMVTNKNDAALVTEILLSLIGIFGVGWIMAGETTIGIILLVMSIFIYWPIMILGTIFTFGLGLICLGPIAIAAIILNFVLLNSVLNRKMTRFIITQPPPPGMTVPPQQN
jgi:hypothetical protein